MMPLLIFQGSLDFVHENIRKYRNLWTLLGHNYIHIIFFMKFHAICDENDNLLLLQQNDTIVFTDIRSLDIPALTPTDIRLHCSTY